MNISSMYSSQNQIYQLIDQYMVIERRPRDLLEQKKTGLSDKKKVLTDLDSRLSALKTKADRLTDIITNYFNAKSAFSSDSDRLTAKASGTAALGSHSLLVSRLASSDTRVSQQYTNDESSLSGLFSEDQTFTVEVAQPTDEDPDNRISISVTVALDDLEETNQNALNAIAEAINTAMSDAVLDETIDSENVVHASVVSEESGKSRLVIRSEQSGYTYRMDFGSSALLDALEINADVQSSGTSGGYMKNVGTGPSDSELNSQFNMDGLTFYRDSNTVDDAINGLTFNLLDTFDTEETITVQADIEAVEEEVQEFIDAYNEVITFLREKAQINPDTYERGPLSSDLLYRGIVSTLRGYAMEEVAGTASGIYSKLYNIGIEADEKGLLSIKDRDKFTGALEANSQYISDIFRAEDGVASKIKDYIEDFVKTNGTIDTNKKNLDGEIKNLKDRISYMDELLAKREKQYYEEFTKLQETMYTIQAQQSYFNSFLQGMYSYEY